MDVVMFCKSIGVQYEFALMVAGGIRGVARAVVRGKSWAIVTAAGTVGNMRRRMFSQLLKHARKKRTVLLARAEFVVARTLGSTSTLLLEVAGGVEN